ncbi:MAG: metal-dependent transcriptional regulator [Planctomycetales bacterium]|nr:metal-dependent transcriptional regulator [Planctomycetales bacterium]
MRSSLTVENYVKAIYTICARSDEPATTGAIAEALSVSPGAVSSMLKTLSESGLAEYTPYEGVRLTEPGRALALRVVRRHRLIELFLARTLEMTWDEVHEEAEHMEHAVSDRLIDRIDRFLDFPAADPHGDPIPQADGSIPAAAATLSLGEWPEGERFRLVRVLDQSPAFLRFLSKTGLSIDAVGRVRERLPEAGVLDVEVDGNSVTLAQEAALKLMCESPGE